MTARLLFIGMWNFADDGGIIPGSWKRLKMQIFPADELGKDQIEKLVSELVMVGLVRSFTHENQAFLQIIGWHHQKIDRPNYRYPQPDSSTEFDECSTNTRRVLDDQSPPEGKGMEGKGKEGNGKDMSAHRGRSISDFEEEFEQFWDVFPRQRRTKKQEAHRKWKLALKRVDAETLTTKAAEYAASEVGRGPYAVMPSVWLNGGCWEDSPEAWQLQPSGNSPQTGKPKQKGKRCLDAEFWKRAGGYNPNLTDEQLNELVEKYAD